MKKLIFGLATILMLVTSCNSDKAVESDQSSSVKFRVENPMLTGSQEANKGVTENKYDIPECQDVVPHTVRVTVDGFEYITEIIGGVFETKEIKLGAGVHIINSFGVYNEGGVAMWAAPQAGSVIANMFNVQGVELEFETKPFEKKLVEIDVLCYEPAYYTDFGFNWFTFTEHQVKEVCFYVNLCRDNFEEWHAEGSPYFGQEYDGKYFSGIIDVVIKGDGWENSKSNVEWQGNGRPLCVEYIDVNGKDDIYIYEVYLRTPDGEKVLIHSDTFTDETAPSFGGADGVWDIRIACDSSRDNCECDCDVDPITIDGGKEKVTLCHKVKLGNDWKFVTITVPAPAVEAHLAHGDVLGACPE